MCLSAVVYFSLFEQVRDLGQALPVRLGSDLAQRLDVGREFSRHIPGVERRQRLLQVGGVEGVRAAEQHREQGQADAAVGTDDGQAARRQAGNVQVRQIAEVGRQRVGRQVLQQRAQVAQVGGNLAAGGEVAQHRGQLAEVGWHRGVVGELTGQGDIGARRNTDGLGGGVGLCRAGDGGAARGNRQNGRRREAEGGDDGGTSPHVHSCGAQPDGAD